MALSQDIDNMTPNIDDGSASPSPDISGDQREASDMAEQKRARSDSGDTGSAGGSAAGQRPNSVSNAKDPLRPRRKKARRACFACQRAHLTCGDERPCQRCIKRGLQDACHDGVRKKAKYLHDAPPEALMPGLASQYNQMSAAMANRLTPNPQGPDVGAQMGPPAGFYSQPQTAAASPAYSIYSQNPPAPPPPPPPPPPHGSMPPPMQENLIQRPPSYPSQQQSPLASGFPPPGSQQPSPMQNMPGPVAPTSLGNQAAAGPQNGNAFGGGGPLFDPSDPALFNFDLASLNFGNHYGALEFGMLGHMSSGAAETPPADNTGNGALGPNSVGGTDFAASSSGYVGSPGAAAPFIFGQDASAPGEWNNGSAGGNVSRQGSVGGHGPYGNGHAGLDTTHRPSGPLAYAIGAGPSSLASASPAESPQAAAYTGYDRPSMSPAYYANANANASANQPPGPSLYSRAAVPPQPEQQPAPQHQTSHPQPQPQPPSSASTHLHHHHHHHHHAHPHHDQHDHKVPGYQMQHVLGKRRRDPSAIYDSVKQPYPYTAGFHGLTAFLQKRFTPQKTLRIAKALASIRPSFISSTKTLNREDLIFMEKCFQRTLFQYEDFINACGTPTIVCRRTGEVAAVGKEFSILTGWKKDVLLGHEANLNVNTGSGDANNSLAVSRPDGLGPNKPAASGPGQPVFLAELLDDDSVIQFYEDFARLAFGDSRGSVMTRCKLLKYKTKDDVVGGGGGAGGIAGGIAGDGDGRGGRGEEDEETKRVHVRKRGKHSLFKGDISTEADMNQLGSRDGKVECTYCWTVKRDVFDIPMLIVMNFLPCI